MSHWASTWAYEQDIQPCGRKFVLVALAGFADEDGFCYPSQDTLATMTGQEVRSVQRHLVALEKGGLIKRKHRRKEGHRTSDGYTLQAPASRLRPKATNCQVAQPDKLSDDKLSPDLSTNRFDPSVKKDPPKSPKQTYRPPIEFEIGPPPPYTGSEFLRQLADFESSRKKLKCPLNELSRVRIYNKLAKFDEATAITALDQAIAGGWKMVYPESVGRNGNGNGRTYESAPERDARYLGESLDYLNNLSASGGQDTPESETRLLPANVGAEAPGSRH